MPSYKLTYFNVRGRAECIRLLFAAAGVEYEDVRFEGKEEWMKVKESSKFGMLPEIDIDGKTFAQSRAIMFYLGREFGYYPSNTIDQLAVDEIVFMLDDMTNALVKAVFAKEDEKEKMMKEFKEVTLVKALGNFEKLAKLNGSTGFFVGGKTTVADIAVYDTLTGLEIRLGTSFDGYPSVKKVIDQVGQIEGIKKWVEKRPKTQM